MNDENISKLFHNLKNDLASMTALLNLHKLYKDDISTEDMLNRLFERQTVISTAYEKLYQEGDYPYVGLVRFINELLSRESRTLNTYCAAVQIKKELADIRLPIKKITPIGQILVELLSNSHRHAFSSSTAERLIEFHISESESILKFEYSDNGCGFDPDFNPSASRTLGMQFIISLSKQLGSKPEFHPDSKERGMHFLLEFEI